MPKCQWFSPWKSLTFIFGTVVAVLARALLWGSEKIKKFNN